MQYKDLGNYIIYDDGKMSYINNWCIYEQYLDFSPIHNTPLQGILNEQA